LAGKGFYYGGKKAEITQKEQQISKSCTTDMFGTFKNETGMKITQK
jgi:hypothetical protein